ncbi:MAG: hypothetical protein FWC34_06295 [Bacteroidetes bacterium]|nr:hypothetical protein [Bacteroidota bacterium]MCL2303340.1 hypothetical protein [Lentimicrobiaceae bacterium]
MKNFLLVIFAAAFMAMPILSYGQQEVQTNESAEKRISYSFINEYGFFGGGTFGFTGVFINGIRFNKTQDLIGIGVGYEADFRSQQSVPFFVNYRHYFPGKKKLKPLVNVGIGLRVSFWQDWTNWYEPYYDENGVYLYDMWYGYSKQRVTPGLYATMAAGFKVRALSFTSGLFMKSWNNEYFGGVEVKVGFTF